MRFTKEKVVTVPGFHKPEPNGPNVRISFEEGKSLVLTYATSSNGKEQSVSITFESCLIFTYGYPNDEVFQTHRLAKSGLEMDVLYEVLHSDWIHTLRRQNTVHPRHSDNMFENYHHYVFAFKDGVFECISKRLIQ